MAQKKYASLSTLSTLVDNIKNLFATKSDLNTAIATLETELREEMEKDSGGSNIAIDENGIVIIETPQGTTIDDNGIVTL